jgi:YD repeat-containing protein
LSDNRTLTNVADAVSSVTNWFNNQGLLVASTNAAGRFVYIVFDALDNPISNGVTVSANFDNLNRLLARAYPDGGIENFGYSPHSLLAYDQ